MTQSCQPPFGQRRRLAGAPRRRLRNVPAGAARVCLRRVRRVTVLGRVFPDDLADSVIDAVGH